MSGPSPERRPLPIRARILKAVDACMACRPLGNDVRREQKAVKRFIAVLDELVAALEAERYESRRRGNELTILAGAYEIVEGERNDARHQLAQARATLQRIKAQQPKTLAIEILRPNELTATNIPETATILLETSPSDACPLCGAPMSERRGLLSGVCPTHGVQTVRVTLPETPPTEPDQGTEAGMETVERARPVGPVSRSDRPSGSASVPSPGEQRP